MFDFSDAPSVTRARIVSVDDGGEHQRLTVEGHAGERFSDVVRAQPHGFTSNPPADAVGYFLRMGSGDRLVALGYETPSRPKGLPPGGKALYDSSGKVLKFIPGEKMDFDAAGQDVVIRNAKSVSIVGSKELVLGAGGRYVRIRPGRVDLAVTSPDGEGPVRIGTEAGPSNVIWGRVD